MNKVINTLKERCSFDYIYALNGSTQLREVFRVIPDSIMKLNPPQDFVEFYRTYDGGHQNFSGHGWMLSDSTVCLTLYSVSDMEKKKKELKKDANRRLTGYCKDHNIVLADSGIMGFRLLSSFRNILIIGEIGNTAVSQRYKGMDYIVFGNDHFYVISSKSFDTIGLRPLAGWLAENCLCDEKLVSATLTGILNKILDVMLKGRQTIFELREDQKKQQAQKPKPIYKVISEAVVDGELPAGFSLPKKESMWADGALDGVSLYHAEKEKVTDEQKDLIAAAVNSAGSGRFGQAEREFRNLLQSARALTIVDPIQEYILNNKDRISPYFIKGFAELFVTDSVEIECVKVGLSMLEFFDLTEDTKDIVRTLALSDEFTLFTVFVMRLWENGNEEIFHAAQKVHGWGRIHALNFLEPETEEIRKWILNEGIRNNVMYEYSAPVCWKKSGAEAMLNNRERLSRNDYSALRDIINALLGDTPVPGISAISDGDSYILKFLEKSAYMDLGKEDYGVITGILDYYSDKELEADVITEGCKALLRGGRSRE